MSRRLHKPSRWDLLVESYSSVRDTRREIVFPAVLRRLQTLGVTSLVDYGGGDGLFAALCARTLRLRAIYSYDPAAEACKLAETALASWSFAQVVNDTKHLGASSFDAVTLNAVWMCLPDSKTCLRVLRDINRLLLLRGHLIASVTHPCFRSVAFSTFHADFNMRDYLSDGMHFPVRISDGEHTLDLVDTHWTLTAVTRQLKKSGFMIEEMEELPDIAHGQETEGTPWLVIHARKTAPLDSQ